MSSPSIDLIALMISSEERESSEEKINASMTEL
jgi:hypothetical protein